MTAEIALMNRNGVALAADSAVTVRGPSGQKIFNTVNKVFMLSKHQPVGVMVFGNATLTGLPWEVIIKSFRHQLGEKSYASLREYGDALLSFIEDNPRIFTEDLEKETLMGTSLAMMFHLLEVIEEKFHKKFESSGQISRQQVQSIMRSVINGHLESYEKLDDLPDRPADFAEQVAARYASVISNATEFAFGEMPVSDSMRKSLMRLASLQFQKDAFPESASGVVVAGFGEDDFFPALTQYEFVGVVLGKAKYRVPEDDRKVCTTHDGFVLPFAQSEMVDLFMEGIDPYYRMVISTALRTFLDGLPDVIVDTIPLSDAQRKSAIGQMQRGAKQLVRHFETMLDDYADANHIQPIVSSVSNLPKEELAAMAEALVNLTSFKRRVTMDPETVGGPIDVAVISKGDGFIWIKRKHYFDPAFNPHFLQTYYQR